LSQKVYKDSDLFLSQILSYIISPYYLLINLFRKRYFLKSIKVKKILILEYHKIGDVIIILPILKSIRKEYPKSELILICCSESYDLISHFNVVDKIIPVKMPWTNWSFNLKSWSKVNDLIKKMRSENIDLAFDFKGDLRNNWFLWKVKAKVSMGYSATGGSFFLTNPFKFDQTLHQRHRAEFIALKAGCLHSRPIRKNKISINGQIVVHPGSSDLRRSWAERKWIKLIQLLSKDFKVAIVKVPESIQLIKQLKKKKFNVEVFSGSLVDFKVWLKKQTLLIGVDSMAGHLAAEIGIPSLSLFGSQNDSLTRPTGDFSIIVKPKKQCHHKRNHWRLCAYCMDEINEEFVYSKILKLIESIKKSKILK
tara:strand:- start:634 stop:1731 length:1098 start_codon:yes stop_codon:yes gene_type:complete